MLLSYYGRPPEGLGSKSSDTDLVSDADRDAERVIRELLEAERPGDGLLAEEGSDVSAASGRRWLVDPLDGTVNFLYGFPAWAVSVALEDDGGVAAGVVLDPVGDECFAAVRGEGARRAERRAPIGVSGEPNGARPRNGGHRLLLRARAPGPPGRAAPRACCRACATSAAPARRLWISPTSPPGRVDAYYERGLNAWDWAAGRLIVEEAGGVVADLDGEPTAWWGRRRPSCRRRCWIGALKRRSPDWRSEAPTIAGEGVVPAGPGSTVPL